MPIVNGTTYADDTPEGVIRVLEKLIGTHRRVAIFYGKPSTGEIWGDVEIGTIGRSTGRHVGRSTSRSKIPLLIKTSRSSGGGALLTDSIVRIEESRKPYRVLYRAHSVPETRRETMAKVYEAWGRPDLRSHMDEHGNVPAKRPYRD